MEKQNEFEEKILNSIRFSKNIFVPHQVAVNPKFYSLDRFSFVLVTFKENFNSTKKVTFVFEVLHFHSLQSNTLVFSNKLQEQLRDYTNCVITKRIKESKTPEKGSIYNIQLDYNAHNQLEYIKRYEKDRPSVFVKNWKENIFSKIIFRKLYLKRLILNVNIFIEVMGFIVTLKVVDIFEQKERRNIKNMTIVVNKFVNFKFVEKKRGIVKSEVQKNRIIGMDSVNKKFEMAFKECERGCTILFHGCEGTGKTSFVNQFVKKINSTNEKMKWFVNKFGANQLLSSLGSVDEKDDIFSIIKKIFMRGQDVFVNLKFILIIDDLDVIGVISKDEEEEQNLIDIKSDSNEMSVNFSKSKLIYVIRRTLDMFKQLRIQFESCKIFVILICKDKENVDEILRCNNRIQREIHCSIPSNSERTKMLDFFFSNVNVRKKLDQRELIKKIANLTPNFTGKDLKRLMTLAKMNAPNRELEWKDFVQPLQSIKPVQLMHLKVLKAWDNPITWDSIGGYEKVKEKCREIIYGPLEKYELYKKLGLPVCSGLLLHGPSGCGKTLLVKALSSCTRMNYISISCSEIFSMYTGETEKTIRNLFQRARELSPCVLVFDEIDSIAPSRQNDDMSSTDGGSSRRALSQLLNEMDGIQSRDQVFIIGCTSLIEMIDSAVLRPGRLDKLLHVPYPSEKDRIEILNCIFRRNEMPIGKDVDVQKIAKMSVKFSGADLDSLCREAALKAIRSDINASYITQSHFIIALDDFVFKRKK